MVARLLHKLNMANKTSIEWTDYNWNFLRGCSRVSEGCRNCYAEGVAARFSGAGMPYEGLAKFVDHKPRWTGEISFHEDILLQPLRWKKPRKVFVNSMSDLFHEKVTDEMLDRAFRVMFEAKQHTFQILTKRPERMLKYVSDRWRYWKGKVWEPAPNIWLGVSVEDQKTADERIPLLLDTPAAVRWISAEPLLGPLDLIHYLHTRYLHGGPYHETERLDWIVAGGESGTNARECDMRWIWRIVRQAKAADVPVFVKQLGALPYDSFYRSGETDQRLYLKNKKGGDIEEFPLDLRVREYPA
jgi:protein gp37